MTTLPPEIDDLLQRMVLQSDEHAFMLIDLSGRVLAWLGAAEKVFGYVAEEMVGQPLLKLFTPEDIEKGMPAWEFKVASADGHAEDDRWMVRKDGRRFWATGIMMPLRAEGGEILAFAKILRNRTDIKGQLESAQKLIERWQQANESENTFIATLTHELRTPLAAMANSLAILNLSGGQNDDCRFARATIQRQLDHLQRMIADLLEVAKADRGKIKLEKQLVVLNQVVKSAVESCRATLDRHTHNLELLMPPQPITVSADAGRLQQVFVNLIENAAKFTSYGGNIWVKVSIEGDEGVVKVEDTGIGISAEMLPRIFDLFTQAEFASSSEAGLGIGLSLVKDLTQMHGGTVQVRSDGVGKGSEFIVRLPLAGPDGGRPDGPEKVGVR